MFFCVIFQFAVILIFFFAVIRISLSLVQLGTWVLKPPRPREAQFYLRLSLYLCFSVSVKHCIKHLSCICIFIHSSFLRLRHRRRSNLPPSTNTKLSSSTTPILSLFFNSLSFLQPSPSPSPTLRPPLEFFLTRYHSLSLCFSFLFHILLLGSFFQCFYSSRMALFIAKAAFPHYTLSYHVFLLFLFLFQISYWKRHRLVMNRKNHISLLLILFSRFQYFFLFEGFKGGIFIGNSVNMILFREPHYHQIPKQLSTKF